MRPIVELIQIAIVRIYCIASNKKSAWLMVAFGLAIVFLKLLNFAPWIWSFAIPLLIIGGLIIIADLPLTPKILYLLVMPLAYGTALIQSPRASRFGWLFVMLGALGIVLDQFGIANWARSIGGILLMIGAFLAFLPLIHRSVERAHESDLKNYDHPIVPHVRNGEYPLWQLHELGQTITQSMKSAMSLISERKPVDDAGNHALSFLVEHFSSRLIGEARWKLSVYVSICNSGKERIVVDDFHAHVYFNSRITIPAPGSIYEWRSRIWIELKEDNSIFKDKVLEIPGGQSVPIAIELEISRFAEQPVGLTMAGLRPKYRNEDAMPTFESDSGVADRGYMLTVFGLFVDYLTYRQGTLIRLRTPSDSVCVFHDDVGRLLTYYYRGNPELRNPDGSFKPPEWTEGLKAAGGATAISLNSISIADYKARFADDPYIGMIVRMAEKSLTSHIVSEHVLNVVT